MPRKGTGRRQQKRKLVTKGDEESVPSKVAKDDQNNTSLVPDTTTSTVATVITSKSFSQTGDDRAAGDDASDIENDAADVPVTTDDSVAGGDTGGKQAGTTGVLQYTDYDVSCEDLAKSLLGQKLVRIDNGKQLSGIIVETEAYIGPVDKAAHSYKGRTPKTEAMFMPPGTAYVYNIYGMYCCMNVSAQGDGAAVLLRALEPCENLEIMDKLRTKGKSSSLMKKEGKGLCNGPSKLCQALAITKNEVNLVDLCSSKDIWIEKGKSVDSDALVKCKRINIGYAKEWVDKPLRFYILGNKFVSVRDKHVEESMSAT